MDIPGKSQKQDSLTSQDSGLGSLKNEVPNITGSSFNKKVQTFSPDKTIQESPEVHQPRQDSYIPLGERHVSGFYHVKEVGIGWPEETKTLYAKGQKIVRMFQRLNTLLADYSTSDRPDRSLHAMSVMLGKPSVEKPPTRVLEDRKSMQEQLAILECKDEWLQAEKAAKETLDMISASTTLYPYSKEALNVSNELLKSLGSEALLILNKVSQGRGKYKPSKSEKALIKKQQEESARNKELQSDYNEVLTQRLKLLEPSLTELDKHMNKISQKHQEEFSPCHAAAREDVRLVDSLGRAKERETEKVSSELLLGSSGLSSQLKYFAKIYFEFQAGGGRQKVEKPRTEEEIKALAEQAEVNRYQPDPQEQAKSTLPPLSHQDSGIVNPDDPDFES
ncbi:MAG: hypothetical protein ACR2PX_09980 [Endozoicomonas sp.]|uniref:hypothetical protein n=1 Tax=Endozoicomonas sp. TaxID=1892382 RepID=UPI003D9B0114